MVKMEKVVAMGMMVEMVSQVKKDLRALLEHLGDQVRMAFLVERELLVSRVEKASVEELVSLELKVK